MNKSKSAIADQNQDQSEGGKNSQLDRASSPSPALARSVLMNQYPLKGIKAEYFTGPTSDAEYEWRTVPMLLRRIADWMDANDLQDPEFDTLEIRTTFADGDDFYETATVYYRENEDSKLEPNPLFVDNNGNG